jgi:hypothetical protein
MRCVDEDRWHFMCGVFATNEPAHCHHFEHSCEAVCRHRRHSQLTAQHSHARIVFCLTCTRAPPPAVTYNMCMACRTRRTTNGREGPAAARTIDRVQLKTVAQEPPSCLHVMETLGQDPAEDQLDHADKDSDNTGWCLLAEEEIPSHCQITILPSRARRRGDLIAEQPGRTQDGNVASDIPPAREQQSSLCSAPSSRNSFS